MVKKVEQGVEIVLGPRGSQNTVVFKEEPILFSVRIPGELHRITKSKAAEEGRTLSDVVTSMLLEYVKDRYIPRTIPQAGQK